MSLTQNKIKILVVLFLAVPLVVLIFCMQGGDVTPASELEKGSSIDEPSLLKKSVLDDSSAESDPREVVVHKRIVRKFAKMDRIILGDEPHIDSRASRRITENRMLAVVDLNSGLNVRKRVSKMRTLSALSEDEMNTLYTAMLKDELPEGVSRASWNWVVDVMMTTLRTQGAETSTMVEKFSEVARTERVDFTVRDYALQHLGHLKGEGADWETVDNVLSEALEVKDATIAGTALLALDNATQSGDLTDEQHIQRAAQAAAIASDTSYSLESRVTALQVAAHHQPESVELLVQQIIAQDDAPEILKLSAQAALRLLTK